MNPPIEMMLDKVDWIAIEPPTLEEQAESAVSGIPYATHLGVLYLAGCEISCVVLSDGRRLITQEGMVSFLRFLAGEQETE